MKKRLLLVCSMILMFAAAKAQDNVLYLRLGPSQFTGVIGGELQIHHFGIEGGWVKLNIPQFDKPYSMGGIGLSYYTGKPFDNSFYGTVGFSKNGVLKITDTGINEFEIDYKNSKLFIVGYKWGGTAWFSTKGGIGYQLSELGNTFTVEFSMAIALLAF